MEQVIDSFADKVLKITISATKDIHGLPAETATVIVRLIILVYNNKSILSNGIMLERKSNPFGRCGKHNPLADFLPFT